MEYIEFNNGIEMPMLGFGTWDVRGSEGEQVILDAIASGYRLIDTAQMYQNEEMIGRALEKTFVPRSMLFLTSKIYQPDTTYEKAAAAIDRSLKALGTDYLDLMLLHEPYELEVSLEMYEALEHAYKAGKLRAIGVSNFSKDFYEKFVQECEVIPVVNQVESHVYYPQFDLQSSLFWQGTYMQAWAPFTEGRRDLSKDKLLCEIAARHNKTPYQIALRYLIENGISAVVKSANKDRMRENMDIFSFELDGLEVADIKDLNEGKSLFGWY